MTLFGRRTALGVLLAVLSLTAAAQQATITPNYKDADLAQIVEAVSAITGKNFIIDPRVRAQVTMLSATPMSADAFYQAFLSILQVHGFVAVPAGNVIKIIPDANARQVPSDDLPGSVSATSDEIVTQVISIHNVSAAQLVPILRPLIPQYGHLAAYPTANMLIISDRANNVNRIMRIIDRIDQGGDDQVDIVQLQNASSAEIVRVVNTLYAGAAAQGEGGGMPVKVVADERSNSVLISGEKSQRLKLRVLVAHLDTPLESGGDTQVRYLRYADAEKLGAKLKEQLQGLSQAAAGGAAGQSTVPAADKQAMIWADIQTNSLVITASPKIMHQVMSIIDKIDIRRAQVQVESLIVEVDSSKDSELGINWALYGSGNSNIPAAVFSEPVGGTSIADIATAIQNPSSVSSALIQGATVGVGRIAGAGTSFAAILRAIKNVGYTNIISTPSVITMDNEEAEIKIATEVPFLTGSYANTTTTSSGTSGSAGVVNPFQTIQREEVGTILKITPQINEGDSVLLKISAESSSLGSKGQAVDLTTNKRTITTKVMVEDAGVIVLGGLIEDNLLEGESSVPVLGSIPLLGNLFKTRNASKTKTNLLFFIRPTILRNAADTAVATNAKYDLLRDRQLERKNGKVTLMPNERQPTLPPLGDITRYADPTSGAHTPRPDTDATSIKDSKEADSKPKSVEVKDTGKPAQPYGKPFGTSSDQLPGQSPGQSPAATPPVVVPPTEPEKAP